MGQRKNFRLSLATLLFSVALFLDNPFLAHATEITIQGYIAGGIAIELKGAFANGVIFDTINYPFENTTVPWLANDTTDFIDFVDDSNDPGFYITVSVTDLAYTGNSQTQQALTADNIKFIGKLNTSTPTAATIGYNNNSDTLNILPDSCAEATADKFTLNTAFTDSNANYTLNGNNAPQTILSSSSSCLVVGRINLDKISITYPAGTRPGSYSSTILFTMTDGQTP